MTRIITDDNNYYDIADAIREKLNVETLYLPSEMPDAIARITTITSEDEGKVVQNGALVGQTSLSVDENGTYQTTVNNEVIVEVSGSIDAKIKQNDYKDYIMDTADGLICTLSARPYYKVDSNEAYVAYCYIETSSSSYEYAVGPILVSQISSAVSYKTMGRTFTSAGSVTRYGKTWYYSATDYFIYDVESSTEGFAKRFSDDVYESFVDAVEAFLDIIYASMNLFASNGTYPVPSGYDGWGEIDVKVEPSLQAKTATENGVVSPDSGYDGLSTVTVNVSGGSVSLIEKTITQNGTYNPADDEADGYSSVVVNVPSSGGGYTHAYTTSTSVIVVNGTSTASATLA